MDDVEVVNATQECAREHCRPDMKTRIIALWVSGVAVGFMAASLAFGFLLT